MRLLLLPVQVDRREPIYAALMAVGLLGIVGLWLLGIGSGILSCFAALYLGATSGSVRSYRTEPGIWMLAMLFVCITAPIWTIFMLADIVPALRGTRAMPWPLVVDASVCTMLFGEANRVLFSVAWHNWRIVRRSSV